MRFYSQNLEDKFIVDRGHEISSILDIGANNGETFSNSRHFIERGTPDLRAVLIEPDFAAFSKLFDLYKQDDRIELVNAAIVPGKRIMKFWTFADALISTPSPVYRDRWQQKPRGSYWQPTIDWDSLFLWFGDRYDLITIDTEGCDPQIISTIPEHFIANCKILVVERGMRPSAHPGHWERNPMFFFARLEALGMKRVHETSENLIYEQS